MPSRKNTMSLMYKVFIISFIVLLPLQASADSKNIIISAGCKTEYYLIKQLSDAYEAETGKKILLGGTGNKSAMALMEQDKIEFAFTCKPIKKIAKKLKINPALAAEWKSIPLAKDPIVVIANSKSEISNLSVEQLTEIFNGNIKNWKAVGGADLPIQTAHITPGMESGMLMLFKEFTVGLKGTLDPEAMTFNDPSGLGRFVDNYSGAITFMPMAAYQNSNSTILPINGVNPMTETVLDGSYSLTATYYLTVDKESSEQVNDFVAFALSEDGKEIIARNYTPISQ